MIANTTVTRICAMLMALVVLFAPSAWGQKTDVVTLVNGDAITGEIKRLDRGKLEYKTDDMSTVEIQWNKVTQLTSIWFFEVELRSGVRYFGTFLDGADSGTVIVALPPDRDTLTLESIVRIQPIEVSFWQQLDGFIDAGFNFAKANKNTTLRASARATYRGRRWGGSLRGETYFQQQTSADQTSRNSTEFQANRFFEQSRWSAVSFAALEQNTALNLAIRARLGAGVARTMNQSNSSVVRASAGLSTIVERFTASEGNPIEDEGSAISLESVFTFEWAAFRFDTPKLDVLTEVKAFPGITDFGRVRSDINVRVSYELIKDFFLSLVGNMHLDSRPPSTDATKVDFSTDFTLGWSF